MKKAGGKLDRKRLDKMSKPEKNERPVFYCDRVGVKFTSRISPEYRKKIGFYLTPPSVADYMAGLITIQKTKIRILDPGVGPGILLCASVEKIVEGSFKPKAIDIVAYEVNSKIIPLLKKVLSYLKCWSEKREVLLNIKIVEADFILAHSESLALLGSLFHYTSTDSEFDVVISNPPYFKISKTDPRAKAASSVVHGQPNMYSLFMAVGATLLCSSGSFIFITPRSFVSGSYFRLLRKEFFSIIQPEQIHIFESRKEAFNRDDVLQENIIIKGIRADSWPKLNVSHKLLISSSHGKEDIQKASKRIVSLGEMLNMDSKEKILRIPASEEAEAVLKLVDSWPMSLDKLRLRISTGPVVPFRAREHLEHFGKVPETHIPLFWMQHVHPLKFDWPGKMHKAQYIKLKGAAKSILLPNKNYVLLRRFSSKDDLRRLTAAPYILGKIDSKLLGLENHLNYIYRPGGVLSENEVWGLAAIFNSTLMDNFFRSINGNTQVNATELQIMPLPNYEIIVRIGREIKLLENPMLNLDELIVKAIGCGNKTKILELNERAAVV